MLAINLHRYDITCTTCSAGYSLTRCMHRQHWQLLGILSNLVRFELRQTVASKAWKHQPVLAR
jgi:hypothetical protein